MNRKTPLKTNENLVVFAGMKAGAFRASDNRLPRGLVTTFLSTPPRDLSPSLKLNPHAAVAAPDSGAVPRGPGAHQRERTQLRVVHR